MKVDRSLIEKTFGTIYVQAGNEFKVDCHLCGKKALWINPDKNVFICFACDSSGNLSRLLPSVKRNFDDLIGDYVSKHVAAEEDANIMVLPAGYRRVVRREQFVDGWDYIEGRGVRPDTVEWGFYNTSSVCFPLREDGYVVYWQSRTILSRVRQKTANPSKSRVGVGRADVVYRIDDLKEGRPAIVVEGVFDALRTKGVATFGKICTQTQALKILHRHPSVIFICYDPDTWVKPTDLQGDFEPSSVRTMRLFQRLNRLIPAIPIRWTGTKDPADLGRQGLLEIILHQIKNVEPARLFLGFSSTFGLM